MIEKVKLFLKKVSAVVAILVLLFTPYLLIVDFNKYAPFIFAVWAISIAYYLFVRRKARQEALEAERETPEGDEDVPLDDETGS